MGIILLIIVPVLLFLLLINIDANVKKQLLSNERIIERLDILINTQKEKDKHTPE
ncbi:hypothetical protein SAMN05518855_101515 [Paenibacillus sp. CF384]|nr:hypothetical protein SAMN05518855_101515 [Paenibacillus sp. CF384]